MLLFPKENYLIEAPHLDRILFFNRDTALIYGYISEDFYKDNKNKVYRTMDGGASWSLVEFAKGDVWVRDGQTFNDGEARLAGSDGRIYATSDFGSTWVALPKMFKSEKEAYDRKPDVYSIHFLDKMEAIATNRTNHIVVSSSNYSSLDRIPSPLDQGLFEKRYRSYFLNGTGRKYVDNWEIDKVRIFKHWYVVVQNGSVYYTKRNEVAWKKVGDEAFNFEVDTENNRMFVVTGQMLVKEVTDDFKLKPFAEHSLPEKPSDIKVMDGNVFLLSPIYETKMGSDKVREQVGGFTVIEKNYKKLLRYNIYRISNDGVQESIVKALQK